MKPYEEDFLLWAHILLNQKLPAVRAQSIYNDLSKTFSTKEKEEIDKKLNSFLRMIMLVCKNETTLITEVFKEVTDLKSYYNGTKEYPLKEYEPIFQMDLTFGKI